MSICQLHRIRYVLCILLLSANSAFAEDANWVKENARLQEKIFTSLGKTPYVDKQQELSVDDIREALILSCLHTAGCSQDEFNDLRAGKPPQRYEEQRGLQHAKTIFGRQVLLRPNNASGQRE